MYCRAKSFLQLRTQFKACSVSRLFMDMHVFLGVEISVISWLGGPHSEQLFLRSQFSTTYTQTSPELVN